jgi:hypothetical protein
MDHEVAPSHFDSPTTLRIDRLVQLRATSYGGHEEMATKKTSTGKKAKVSKTAFVRSLPPEMSAKEVVEKAKAQNITLSEAYVYTLRSSFRRAGSNRASSLSASAKGHGTSSRSSEATFRRLVLDLGVQRARELLSEVEGKLTAIIAGR